jgi:hypothetical protein
MGKMRWAALVAAMALVGGCTAGGAEATPEANPDGVLLQYNFEGGFMPFAWSLRKAPDYTLLTDGRLITPGFTDLRFPGALVPTFMVTQLTDGELRQIRTLIERMGLADITEEHDDTGSDQIADAPMDVLTFWDSKGTHVYSAYAPGHTGTPGNPKTVVLLDIRRAFEQLAFGREQTAFEPTRMRVVVGDAFLVDPDFAEVVDWPLTETDLSSWAEVIHGWKCKAFDADLLSVFATAHEAMLWRSPVPGDDTTYGLIVRPLLPGEPDCPSP